MSAAPGGDGAAGVEVYADEAPPPLPDYDQPPVPGADYMWTPGYWAWNGYEYFWVPGTWIEPPQPGLLWTPGYWAFVGGVYAFHRGYWGERVGFYGGVDYGFGYGGVGYEGGRWDNGRFFYNRAITNIGRAAIANVYSQPVAVREASRLSFNGGPNGVNARPTAAELEAAKEKHIAPTPDQLHNARVAGRTESAFVSANKGKPGVAATAKPGEFKGEAVVHAKAAGGPLQPAGATTTAPGATNGPTPEPTKGKFEKKPGKPTPEPTKAGPENKVEPLKVEPTPEATKTKPGNKLEGPTPRPTKLETPKPEPTKLTPELKIERSKPEPTRVEPQIKVEPTRPQPTRTEPMKVEPQNKPEPRNFAPAGNNAPKGAPEGRKPPGGACGHPGERPCPK